MYYNNLDANIRNNIILIKQALREYYNNENRRWQKRQELFSLKKGEQTLDTYIDKINKLSQQLDVGAEVKIDLFINGLDERLSKRFEDAATSNIRGCHYLCKIEGWYQVIWGNNYGEDLGSIESW